MFYDPYTDVDSTKENNYLLGLSEIPSPISRDRIYIHNTWQFKQKSKIRPKNFEAQLDGVRIPFSPLSHIAWEQSFYRFIFTTKGKHWNRKLYYPVFSLWAARLPCTPPEFFGNRNNSFSNFNPKSKGPEGNWG